MVAGRKAEIYQAFKECCQTYQSVVSVDCSNMPSKKLQEVRQAMLAKNIRLLFGKNTYLRAALKELGDSSIKIANRTELCQGNVGFAFTNGEVSECYDMICDSVVPARAKAGMIANAKVIIEAHMTGINPSNTAAFQVLSIPTRITKGQLEVLNPVELIEIGDRVSFAQAALLKLLNKTPFSYRLEPRMISDGDELYPAAVLAINAAVLTAVVSDVCWSTAALSLATHSFNALSAQVLVRNAYRESMALCVATNCIDVKTLVA